MKKILTLLMLLVSVGFAQTYHTITIDGGTDFTPSTEGFVTTSGNREDYWQTAYITWDATKLYIGYRGQTPNGALTDDNRIIQIYIDTDPQTSPTNGTGTTDGEAWRWDPTLPFTANYHYVFKTHDNSQFKRAYSSKGWNNASFTTQYNKNTSDKFWELSILLSDLGSPTKIYVCAYIEEDWNGGNISLGIPSDLFTNTNTQGSITFNNHWLGFNLVSGVTPNDGSNHDQALPVELTTFTAVGNGSEVVLNWQTATEVNNYGFEIERAITDSELRIGEFTKIGFVEGHGNSNSTKNYEFTDSELPNSIAISYRLKQIDTDGKYDYSDIVEVNVANQTPSKFELSQNYPNPFNPSTEISFSIPQDGNVKLTVFNSIGQEITTLMNQHKESGSYKVKFDASKLTSGIYFYKLESGSFVSVKKMMLIK